MTVIEGLTVDQATRLEHKERVIERGLTNVGEALAAIREERLYRENYSTFDEYCQKRWGMNRQYVDRQIAAATVAACLSPIGLKPGDLPESQARELRQLLDDPDRMRQVYLEASAASGGRPTAQAIREARDGIPPTPEREPQVNTDTGEVSDAYPSHDAPGGDTTSAGSTHGVEPGNPAQPAEDASAHRSGSPAVADAQPAPEPPTTAAPGAAPKPRRTPLPDSIRNAVMGAETKLTTLRDLTRDDRWPRNAEEAAPRLRNDLKRIQDLLDQVTNSLPTEQDSND